MVKGIWMQTEKTKLEKETGVSSDDSDDQKKPEQKQDDRKPEQKQDAGNGSKKEAGGESPVTNGADKNVGERDRKAAIAAAAAKIQHVKISSKAEVKVVESDNEVEDEEQEDEDEEAGDEDHPPKALLDSPFRDPVAVLFEKILEG